MPGQIKSQVPVPVPAGLPQPKLPAPPHQAGAFGRRLVGLGWVEAATKGGAGAFGRRNVRNPACCVEFAFGKGCAVAVACVGSSAFTALRFFVAHAIITARHLRIVTGRCQEAAADVIRVALGRE